MSKTKMVIDAWKCFIDFGHYCVEKYGSRLNFPKVKPKHKEGITPRRERDPRKTQREMSRNTVIGHARNKESSVDMTDIH